MSSFETFLVVGVLVIFGSIILSISVWVFIWFIKWVAGDDKLGPL